MNVSDIHGWYVALHHRTTRGDYARHTEPVGVWLRKNAECLLRGEPDDWIAIGIAPSPAEASALLDRFQDDMER